MDAPKIAPWPWVVDDGDSDVLGVFDADGEAVCYLSENTSNGPLRPEDPIHASLIAAAPELLAALRDLRNQLASVDLIGIAIRNADLAIAKADTGLIAARTSRWSDRHK